jgi:hypothetical protein
VFACIRKGKDSQRVRDIFFNLGPLTGGVGAANAVVSMLKTRAEFRRLVGVGCAASAGAAGVEVCGGCR